MENNFYRSTGLSLILGSILAIITMVFHPAGGSLEHIINIAKPLTYTHALGTFSLPFMLFGFYGMTYRFLGKWRFSVLAFIIISFGLLSAMMAAILNGLALPYFLTQYADNIELNSIVLRPIVNYGFALNKAFDYVFIVAFCSTITIYSVLIIIQQKFQKWIGYLGFVILIFAIAGAISNFTFTNLFGFRIVVLSIAIWVLFSGISLIKSKK